MRKPLYSLRVGVAAAAVVAAAGFSASAFQDSKSSVAVKELAHALDAAKLEAIAAADPSEPGTYVAALYFPGSQILVVSAKYAAPPLLNQKLASKDYRDIYIDLNSASVAGTKIFVMDQNVNGLIAKPDDNQGFDTWEQGKTQVTFDGQWKKAKMSEDDYMKAFSAADERYAKILSLLTAQAKQMKGTVN
jgi:type II secretory pathway pseudopilin PulG